MSAQHIQGFGSVQIWIRMREAQKLTGTLINFLYTFILLFVFLMTIADCSLLGQSASGLKLYDDS